MTQRSPIRLLKDLIAIPSFSGEEAHTADRIQSYLKLNGVEVKRLGNNVYAFNEKFDSNKANVLLNSHHDTVKPNGSYTVDPFLPIEENGRLYGLGSNDAGASLVALSEVFLRFYHRVDMPFNLIFAASAEEEISGRDGIEKLLRVLPPISLAIVGEPTNMKLAIAERGLLVVDCMARGTASHVAHYNGNSALYHAMDDIAWLRSNPFERHSEKLGMTQANVTVIKAGELHNVVPDACAFVADIRVNDRYALDEIMVLLKENLKSEVRARSMRLNPSAIEWNHPIVEAAHQLGIETFGSSTMSDMALMDFNSVKIGPGDSLRSHSANEFVGLEEIENGITLYTELINAYMKSYEIVEETNR